MTRFSFTALVVLVLLHLVQGELVMVYSIQRHGARNVLPKTSTLKESKSYGGPTLLPQGKKQCYDAGMDGWVNVSTAGWMDGCAM